MSIVLLIQSFIAAIALSCWYVLQSIVRNKNINNHLTMHVKCQVMVVISMVILSNMFGLIMCVNKRIKIYVPEHIKHVHHHHVKKVPVYIVTKEKPRVMHASHIEDDDFQNRKIPRTKFHTDYDDDLPIQGIYKGDESHVHEDVDTNYYEYTTLQPQPPIETKKYKLPNLSRSQNTRQKNHQSQYAAVAHYNQVTLYD